MNTGLPPRVVLLTTPSLYGAIIIDTLAGHPGLQLVGIGLTNRVYRGQGLLATIRTSIERTGWRYTFYNALVGNIAWALLGIRGRPKAVSAVHINTRLIEEINAATTITWLQNMRPDYVASFYFNQWIGAAVRDVPSRDCINLHPSLLPALRGPDPAFQTLARRLTTGGFTIHRIADEFDAGAILSQCKIGVNPAASVFSLYCAWARQASEFLGHWLAMSSPPQDGPIATADSQGATDSQGGTRPINQCSEGDYETFPTPSAVREFLRSGGRLIRLGEFWRCIREMT